MTLRSPVISVVIPLFNKEKEVHRALRSVLTQTFQDIEVIVINDGSVDHGAAVVSSFADPRIKLINQENQGVAAARNRGIAEATADLIGFLDADDKWAPDYLETINRLVNKYPAASVYATGYVFTRDNGKDRIALVRGLPEDFTEGILENYFLVASQSDPPLSSSTVTLRKYAIESIGGFPLGITSGEDLLTWARLAVRFRIAYLKEPKARLWHPLNADERPGRIPAVPDFVGDGLKNMLSDIDPLRSADLKKYIALWYTMRAVIYIQLADGRAARNELAMSSGMTGMSIKKLLLYCFTFLPGRLGRTLYDFRQQMKVRKN